MPKYILSLTEKSKYKYCVCVMRYTLPSDFIKRPKPIDYSELEQDLMILQSVFKNLDYLGKCTNVVFSIKPRKGDG